MILVTTGTNGVAFDRLLAGVRTLGNDEPLVVQHGPSSLRPDKGQCYEYLPFQELAELVSEARVVITHGGAGSILLAQLKGKRPLVVPRLARFREAVDDHQLELTRRMDKIGLATLVEEAMDLPELVRLDHRLVAASDDGAQPSRLVEELKAYIGQMTAPRDAEA